MERVVAHRHSGSGDGVAATRRVRGDRGVGGVGLFLVEGDSGALALEFVSGNMLEGFVVGSVALVGGVAGSRGRFWRLRRSAACRRACA